MPHIDLGDVKCYYELHGEGAETITLLNGLTMSTVAWAAQVKDFSPLFRVLLLDMRGQGQTVGGDEEVYPLSRQADDCLLYTSLSRQTLLRSANENHPTSLRRDVRPDSG